MQEIIEILKKVVPGIDVTNQRLVDDGLLDSFDMVWLIGELNESFDITITAEDLIPKNFNSVEAMAQLIKNIREEK